MDQGRANQRRVFHTALPTAVAGPKISKGSAKNLGVQELSVLKKLLHHTIPIPKLAVINRQDEVCLHHCVADNKGDRQED